MRDSPVPHIFRDAPRRVRCRASWTGREALAGVAALLVFALGALGCSTTDVSNHRNVEGPRLKGIATTETGGGAWGKYLAVMTPRERKHFQEIEDSDKRRLFIRQNGVDVRRTMQDRLKPGMTETETVRALDGVYQTAEFQQEPDKLYFSAYNGTARTHLYCFFAPSAETPEHGQVLASWGSFTDQQVEETRKASALESVLNLRLSRVLREGMGYEEIRTGYAKAGELLKQYETAAIARHDAPEYVGFKAPSVSDYAVEAEWLRAHAHVNFYDVLRHKPDFVKNEGTSEYWYHVYPISEDSEVFVVVEYRFVSARLISWFVYHTDFLGYPRERPPAAEPADEPTDDEPSDE